MVGEAWEEDVHAGHGMTAVGAKFANCRSVLDRWSKTKVGNLGH